MGIIIEYFLENQYSIYLNKSNNGQGRTDHMGVWANAWSSFWLGNVKLSIELILSSLINLKE